MKASTEQVQVPVRGSEPGVAIYSRPMLFIYDFYVLGFSNTFAWRCPSRRILDFYNKHISANHLDVGVGTGYFLDKCQFPTPDPKITLVDLNNNSLQVTEKRLRRYNPRAYVANVLDPLQLEPDKHDSIGLNYLLHCLPGNIRTKGIVFKNLKPLLNVSGGVIFGTTLLGQNVNPNLLAKTLMRIYNSKGIFSNTHDNLEDLVSVLQENFREYSVEVVGCVAFFSGRT